MSDFQIQTTPPSLVTGIGNLPIEKSAPPFRMPNQLPKQDSGPKLIQVETKKSATQEIPTLQVGLGFQPLIAEPLIPRMTSPTPEVRKETVRTGVTLKVGDIVKKFGGEMIRGSKGSYPFVVVINTVPFTATTMDCQDRWSLTLDPKDFFSIGVIDGEALDRCMKRLRS